MTKRDYELIVRVIRTYTKDDVMRSALGARFCTEIEKERNSASFDREKFMRAVLA